MTRNGSIVRRVGITPVRLFPREEKPANGNIPKRLSEKEKRQRDKSRKNLAVLRAMEKMREAREKFQKEKNVLLPRVRKGDAKKFLRQQMPLAA